ncbi:MAG: isochorismate synthase [Candidatus Marinimicrobia bacterium]|nr:isochorismate synthase [Candidatus Neomarinimicrobiota bacterium]
MQTVTEIEFSPELSQIEHGLASLPPDSILQYTFDFKSDVDLLEFSQQFLGTSERVFFWEVPEENSRLLSVGSIETCRVSGDERFSQMDQFFTATNAKIQTLNGFPDRALPRYMVAASFFTTVNPGMWDGFSPGLCYLPRLILKSEHDQISGTLYFTTNDLDEFSDLSGRINSFFTVETARKMSPDAEEFTNFELHLNGEKRDWLSTVNACLDTIRRKQIHKVVLGTSMFVRTDEEVSPVPVLRNLRATYPSCINYFYQETNGHTFLGATPEWLMRIRDSKLYCDALAGSAPRHHDLTVDKELGDSLLRSPKNLHEHQFVVNHLKQELKSFAKSIENEELPVLQKLPNVQHLHTPVTADLHEHASPFEIMKRLHPTPAVGGIPTESALEIIRDIEQFERGYYAGPIGWVQGNGDVDIAVGLRSGLLTSDDLNIFAGAGIVENSDPADEYDELQIKMQPLLSAIGILNPQ